MGSVGAGPGRFWRYRSESTLSLDSDEAKTKVNGTRTLVNKGALFGLAQLYGYIDLVLGTDGLPTSLYILRMSVYIAWSWDKVWSYGLYTSRSEKLTLQTSGSQLPGDLNLQGENHLTGKEMTPWDLSGEKC